MRGSGDSRCVCCVDVGGGMEALPFAVIFVVELSLGVLDCKASFGV